MNHRIARISLAVALSVSVVSNQSMGDWPVGVLGGAKRVVDKRAASSDALGTVNTPPIVSKIADRIIPKNGTATAVFQVNDAETPADKLTVVATSDNADVLQESRMEISGVGGERTLTATPALDTEGTATVTVTVTDEAGLSKSTRFSLTAKTDLPYVAGEMLVTYRKGAVPSLGSPPSTGARAVIGLRSMRPLLRDGGRIVQYKMSLNKERISNTK